MFSFLETTADPGASIQAAEIGADIASIVTTPVRPVQGPLRFFRGVTAAVRNAIIGRLFTNPRSRQLILGAGQRPLDFTALRAAAVITSEMVADVLDARTKKEEQ